MLAEELNLFQYSCNHLMDYTCHSRSEHDLRLRRLVPVHSARFSDANALHKGVWNGWSCSTDVTDQHESEQLQKMKPQVLEDTNIHSWTSKLFPQGGFLMQVIPQPIMWRARRSIVQVTRSDLWQSKLGNRLPTISNSWKQIQLIKCLLFKLKSWISNEGK